MSLTLGHLQAFLGLNTVGLTKGLAGAQASLNAFGTSMQRTGKLMTTALSVPLGILSGVVVVTFAKFEKAMNQVAAVTLATQNQMSSLEQVARGLGETTKFTAVEAAEGMNFLAMAGFEVEEVISSLPHALNLAAAGNMELGRSADIVSNIMRGFNIEASRTEEVADILTKTFTNANANLEQIGESMAFAAPVAKAFGQSIATTAAAVGMLGDAGIQGSRAGTAMRQMLIQLSKKSQDLGIVVRKANGDFRDLSDILLDIERSGLRADVAIATVGPRAGVALAALMERGSTALRNFSNEVENAAGITASIAKTQLQGLYGAFVEMRSAATELAISFGEMVGPALEKLVDNIKAAIKRWSRLDERTKKIIITVVALVAAIGPAIFIIGKLVAVLSLLWGPIGIAILAIAALGAAILYIVDNWDAVIERVSDWSWWKNVLIDMAQFFLKWNIASLMIMAINKLAKVIGPLWDKVVSKITDIKWWKEMLINMVQFFLKYNPFALINKAIAKITGIDWKDMFGGLTKQLDKVRDQMAFDDTPFKEDDLIPNIFELVAEGLEGLRDDTKEYEHEFGSLKDAMINGAALAGDALTKLFDIGTGGAGIGGAKASGFTERIPDITPKLMPTGGLNVTGQEARLLTGAFKEADDGGQKWVMTLDNINRSLALQAQMLETDANWLKVMGESMTEAEEVADKLGTAVQNALNTAFVELGETLGEVFSGGKIDGSLFSSILEMLSGFMKAFGAALIAVGVAKVAFENLMLSGWGAIVAGVALVAAAVVVKNIMSKGTKPQGLASGGLVTSGGVFQLHKNEMVSLPAGSAVTPANMSGRGGTQTIVVRGVLTAGEIRFMLEEEARKLGNTF